MLMRFLSSRAMELLVFFALGYMVGAVLR